MAATAGLLLLVSSCSGSDDASSGHVTRAEFDQEGLTWPVSVDAGTFRCEPGDRLLFQPDGSETVYAVNGLAKDEGRWAAFEDTWLPDPGAPELRLSAGSFTDRGLQEC